VSLDLSQIDAKLYMFLALTGPKNALSIVNNLRVSKQQISQSLVNLQNKGIPKHSRSKSHSSINMANYD
jgi:predicted transcriptional regulator